MASVRPKTPTRVPVVIAVDAGTGSARALAFDSSGRVVAQASREWTHRPLDGHPGGTVFDTAAGWTLIAAAVREVVGRVGAGNVVALAASSMREGFVLFDEHGTELWACPNTDGRARVQAESLVRSGAAGHIYAVAGDWVSITAPARLRWIAEEQPEILARTRHLGMLSDWIAYRLTGVFSTEPTCGSSSALFDLRARCWSPELAELVGINNRILPPVVECGTVLGGITADASTATGIPLGVPVVAGGADTQLALYAIDARPTVPNIVAGSFWQTTAVTALPIIDPSRRLRTLCHVGKDSWMIEGIGFLSGLAMRWARDGLTPDLVQRAAHTGESAYALMEHEARGIPVGSNGVVAILSDVMQADAWHHAAPAIVGFDLTQPEATGRAAIIRAIEEAAAYVARAHLDVLDELTGGLTATGELTLVGGSSSALLWPHIVAGVTNRRVRRAHVSEATSLGAARLAGNAVGMLIAAASTDERIVLPDAHDVAAYDLGFAHWKRAYAAQREATRDGGFAPLFVPPGGFTDSTETKEAAHGRF